MAHRMGKICDFSYVVDRMIPGSLVDLLKIFSPATSLYTTLSGTLLLLESGMWLLFGVLEEKRGLCMVELA